MGEGTKRGGAFVPGEAVLENCILLVETRVGETTSGDGNTEEDLKDDGETEKSRESDEQYVSGRSAHRCSPGAGGDSLSRGAGIPCPAGPARNLLVELELLLPVLRVLELRLKRLIEEIVAHHEVIHLGPHKATVRVLRRADDGLAPDVEARVDDHATPRLVLELVDEGPVPRVCFPPHALYPRGVVDMRDRRDVRAEMVEPVVKLEVIVSRG